MSTTDDGLLHRIGIAAAVFSGLSCLCSIPTLRTYIHARNFPVCVLFSSLTLQNLMHLLNAILWPHNNVEQWWNGSILCDIEVKLIVGLHMAVNSSIACILRQSMTIFDPTKIGIIRSRTQKRWDMVVEVVACVVIPCVLMCLQYIVQPQRYMVYPIHGCFFAVDPSWLSYILVEIWPSTATLMAFSFDIVLLYRLVKHHREIKNTLLNRMNRTETSRFVRLSIAASVMTLFAVADMTFHLFNFRPPLYSYSWERVHSPNWSSDIILVPSYSVEQILSDLVLAVCSFQLFLWFSLGSELAGLYKKMFNKIGLTKILRKRSAQSSSNVPNNIINESSSITPVLHPNPARSFDEVDMILENLERSQISHTEEV